MEGGKKKALKNRSGKVMGPGDVLELWRSYTRLGTSVLYSCLIPEGRACGRASSEHEHIHARNL